MATESSKRFIAVRIYDRADDLAERAAAEKVSIAKLVADLIEAGWDTILESPRVLTRAEREAPQAPVPNARVYSPFPRRR